MDGYEREQLDRWITGDGDGGLSRREHASHRDGMPMDFAAVLSVDDPYEAEPMATETRYEAMSGEQAGALIVEILKAYGVGVSRETVLSEFWRRRAPVGAGRGLDIHAEMKRGLAWARKRCLIIPTIRRHRGERVYWRYCGDEA